MKNCNCWYCRNFTQWETGRHNLWLPFVRLWFAPAVWLFKRNWLIVEEGELTPAWWPSRIGKNQARIDYLAQFQEKMDNFNEKHNLNKPEDEV